MLLISFECGISDIKKKSEALNLKHASPEVDASLADPITMVFKVRLIYLTMIPWKKLEDNRIKLAYHKGNG